MAGRWALSIEVPGLGLADHEPVVRAAEAAGYTDVWSEETQGHDAFTPLAVAAGWTKDMRLGTGVVNAFTRGPAVLAQHCVALQEASGGRFVLGIGSSSNVIVERWNGIPFEKPRTRVRETVEFLRAALAGERAAEGGFKLGKLPPEPVPIYIAALRERMLQTAGEIGDGAFLNYTPLSKVPAILAEIRKGEEAAGKDPGSTDVMCRFFCIQGDPEQGLGLARWMFAAYATVPVYENFFRWLGYGDAIDPMVEAWRAKDRQRALELVPTELVEEVFVLGDADAQRARLAQYVESGVNIPMILPIPIVAPGTPVAADTFVELVESLAPNR